MYTTTSVLAVLSLPTATLATSDAVSIWSPIFQYGFAGFAAALLAIVFWQMRSMFLHMKDVTNVIAENTRAIQASSLAAVAAADALRTSINAIDSRADHLFQLMDDLRTRLLERPCLIETHPEHYTAVS